MRYTWALLVALATCASASNCYYPDGSRANDYDYEPCGNTNYSTCCYFAEGDKCLSNGLCSNPGKYDYYRAACANKDWSNCPHACMNEDSDNWLGLTKCGENKYCCPSGGDDCCTNGAKVYTLKVSNSTDTSSGDSTESGSSSQSSANSSSSQSADTGSSGSSSVPAGPIAGGVVGGVFFIGFIIFGFVFFKRRGKKNTASASIEAGSFSGSGSNDKGSDEPKPIVQKSLAEIEGSQGKVWNETDGKPVVSLQATYEEEQSGYYKETTPGYSQQGVAEVDGEPVRNANPGALIPGSTAPKRSDLETTQHPSQRVAAELDGGAVKTANSGAFVSSFEQNGPETVHSPLQQSTTEAERKDIIRPDSGTLAPDWPMPGQNGLEATQRFTQPALSGAAPTSTNPGHDESKTSSRPGPQNVAEAESGATLTLDLSTFDPVFTAFEQDQTGATPPQDVVEAEGGVVTAAQAPAYTEQKTMELRQSTGQQGIAEVSGGVISESNSTFLTSSTTQSTAIIQDSTQQVVEAGRSVVVEAESPKEMSGGIPKPQAIEADSNALSEADSNPVPLGSKTSGQDGTQMKFLRLA